MWSRFWYCSDTAGPGILDVARFWDREPRVLRLKNRSLPDPWIREDTYMQPTPLSATHAAQVAEFWRTHYGATDWWLDASNEWVHSILASPSVLALGVFHKQTGALMGTIVSRPTVQKGAYLLLGDHTFLHDSRVIEGLCIHPDWRRHHLAGWLIAWMDYWTHTQRPTVHFWFREVPSQTPWTTEICRATWVYARIAELPVSTLSLTAMSLAEFEEVWNRSVPTWRQTEGIFASRPFWGDTMEEGCWELWKSNASEIVVLQNTRRRTRPGNETIWEVAWCGTLSRGGLLRPGLLDARPLMEAAALQNGRTNGLVFGTDEPHHGGASLSWEKPWKFGTSGAHLTFLYNYMPPAFWRCNIELLRTEI